MSKDDCSFLYFKTKGKWKYDGRGVFPDDAMELTREKIAADNGGCMPGLAEGYLAEELTIIVIPDESCNKEFAYPRMLLGEERPVTEKSRDLPVLSSSDMGEQFRHIKTGKIVQVVRECIRESDLSVGVLYREIGSYSVWFRPKSEFYDGRFERL